MSKPHKQLDLIDLRKRANFSDVEEYTADLFVAVRAAVVRLKGEQLTFPDALATACVLESMAKQLLEAVGYKS